MTKPTDAQIQRACDLAGGGYRVCHYGSANVFTALADTIAQLDAMQARAELAEAHAAAAEAHVDELQAERNKARADLGEIDRIAVKGGWWHHQAAREVRTVAAIAACHRVETDPLVELLHAEDWATLDMATVGDRFRNEALKRGLEIGRSA